MADQKITQLTDLATLDNADIIPIVDDVAGTPVTKKVTLTTLKAFLKTYFDSLYGGGVNFTFTGDGTTNRAIAHGLGRVPKMVIIDAPGYTGGYAMVLGSTPTDFHNPIGGSNYAVTAMTDTYVYVRNFGNVNGVAYSCFAI